MDSKSAKTLPKTLPGVVCVQWRTCGKMACRCAQGKPHGPYYYRFWRDGGRLRKAYVPRQDAADVQARCQTRRTFRRWIREANDMIRSMRDQLREVEAHERD